jgi:hypothetical protein
LRRAVPPQPDFDPLRPEEDKDAVQKAVFATAVDWLLVNYAYREGAFMGKGGVISGHKSLPFISKQDQHRTKIAGQSARSRRATFTSRPRRRGDRVKRRAFIAALGGAAAWPVAGRAQPSDRKRRIGLLMNLASDDADAQSRNAAFLQGLQELGWVVGRNVANTSVKQPSVPQKND